MHLCCMERRTVIVSSLLNHTVIVGAVIVTQCIAYCSTSEIMMLYQLYRLLNSASDCNQSSGVFGEFKQLVRVK